MIHCTAIGNLGKDAESKVTQTGKTVTSFNVATQGRGKDSPTTWIRASMWGERGTKVKPYLTKGSRVAVVGTLTTREYEGKTYVEIDVQELELLGGKPNGDKPSAADEIPF